MSARILASFLTFAVLISTAYSNFPGAETASRRQLPSNLCGSRLVDRINQLCHAKLWEPKRCFIATKYYCRRGIYRNNPFCYFKCPSLRKRRSTSSYDHVDTSAYINHLNNLMKWSHPGHSLSDLIGNSNRSRRRRNINRECCNRRCSVRVIQEYCDSGR